VTLCCVRNPSGVNGGPNWPTLTVHTGRDRSIADAGSCPGSTRTPCDDAPLPQKYAANLSSALPPKSTPLGSTHGVPSSRRSANGIGVAGGFIAGSDPGDGKRRSVLLHGSTKHNTDAGAGQHTCAAA